MSILGWFILGLIAAYIAGKIGNKKIMRPIGLAALMAVFIAGSAIADDTCQSKAVGKDGKPLAGAALTSFMTKCMKDSCESKAVDKNGKKLYGAAKDSFMKKCQSDG
jgi:uncharacterized membrane protein YeaQ/YmgE (transglycosylase-associated protein family)